MSTENAGEEVEIVDSNQPEPEPEKVVLDATYEDESGFKGVTGKGVKSVDEALKLDQNDESLRKWKEALIAKSAAVASGVKDVEFVSIILYSPDLPEPREVTFAEAASKVAKKEPIFTIKQGSEFTIAFTFKISNQLVLGLKCVTQIYRLGVPAVKDQIMFGCYSPSVELHKFTLPASNAPKSPVSRGLWLNKIKFTDDENRDHGSVSYYFKIDKTF